LLSKNERLGLILYFKFLPQSTGGGGLWGSPGGRTGLDGSRK
jgi:hypothetical protein